MIDYLAGVTELRGKTTNLRTDHQNLVLETWGNRWNMLDLYKLNIDIYSFANVHIHMHMQLEIYIYEYTAMYLSYTFDVMSTVFVCIGLW